MKKILRMIALCLCLALLAGCALAETEVAELSKGPDRELYYQGIPMKDGRLLLNGRAEGCRAMLLCLNADRTKSWEYIEPDIEGYTDYYGAAVLEDGTVAVVRCTEPDDGEMKWTALFFSQDGTPTGKETDLTDEGIQLYAAYPDCMVFLKENAAGGWDTVLKDWDGKEIARHDGMYLHSGYGGQILDDGGLVLLGTDKPEKGSAKVMKVDIADGRILWETTLERQWAGMESAVLGDAVKTADGGYAAVLWEEKGPRDDGITEAVDFLVKFDSEGKLQWVYKDTVTGDKGSCLALGAYDGKIVAYRAPEGGIMGTPQYFQWMDMDGNVLGTTEMTVKPEDFSAVGMFYDPEDTAKIPEAMINGLVPMADGLWASALCEIMEKDDDGYYTAPFECNEYVMIKVPELP